MEEEECGAGDSVAMALPVEPVYEQAHEMPGTVDMPVADESAGFEAGGSSSGWSWLREEDQAAFEEDAERNAEQAGRNIRMRQLLRERRERKATSEVPPPQEVTPEDFMEVGKGGGTSSRRAVVKENQPPWYVARPHLENVALRLHEELLDFDQFMKHTPEEIQARRDWVRTIGGVCRNLWPKSQIRIFGSFYTGLSLPNGDVDVAVLNVPCRPGTAMKILADTMLASGEISWLEIIESAKVPVMKVRSRSCGLRADIVFNMQDGLQTSKFIRQSLKDFPQMRPLLVFIKYFLLQRGLNDTFTGGMGSYLLCNVVLHFLQRHPCMKDPRLYSATSLGHLLFDLLKYYGRDFRYDVGISVLDGGYTFRKEERGWGGKGKSKGKGGIQLCLESPLGSPPSDLGAPAFRMSTLRNLFHHGYHCLSHLFVTQALMEDGSLLCPLLLDPAHGVITSRYELMAQQPAALASLQRSSDFQEGAEGDGPMAKRMRLDT
mmetsp:Transcript_91948/g.231189  ORF Transcript_91948/g.231189 Transcript_91948/m.231189 type:complete len:490 (-) Transcript_91948:113-1582(-)